MNIFLAIIVFYILYKIAKSVERSFIKTAKSSSELLDLKLHNKITQFLYWK